MAKKKQIKASKKALYGRLRDRGDLTLLAENIAASLVVSWLFYDVWWMAAVLFVPLSVLNGRRFREKQKKEFERRFILEYKEFLRNLISGLETGYSVENAFLEAERQHRRLFDEKTVLLGELHAINASVELRTPIEKAFTEFSERHPYEEVESFASVFSFGKSLGGNYVENLRTTARKLEEKVELKEEIAATFAEKQLELQIMSVMPLGIVVYMKLGSPGFMAPVYGNPLGIVIMTGCICIYAVALVLGKKVVDIEV
ncbi:MAG: type II secretion system F family protein [Lachnospiraceae bacterium]|nr:type II secretion system F family protein [Lachnospiraceae bacterium]